MRLENASDGVPGISQEPVGPGGTFLYRVHFKDAGLYWYHPHVREDVQQDMGLYGNLLIDSPRPDYYSPVNSEEVLMLDDLLFDGDSLVPYGKESSPFTIMGRFGNVMLVNGETQFHKQANAGDVIRFFLTNVSNTRTFNLSFGGAPIKLVASDVSKFEHEVLVPSVLIAPAERYIIEVKFDKPGEYMMVNKIQALDHMMGEFYHAADTLGMVMVDPKPTAQDQSAAFKTLRSDPEVKADIDRYRAQFDRPPDKDLLLTVDVRDLPIIVMQFISIDTTYRSPVEFTDTMADINWISTGKEVRWILKDMTTSKENMDIDWHVKQGEVVKVRIRNDAKSFHPMNHPIHFHGQRFLVLATNGVKNDNLVWKDTVLLPVGTTADLLVEASNPGKWMLHCHIAEHLEAGMMALMTVDAN